VVDVIPKEPYCALVRWTGGKTLEVADDVADVWNV
jgi:hypothetical protein